MAAVRCGFKSRAEVVSEMGYDVEEIDAEIAADNERARELGLNLASSLSLENQKEEIENDTDAK